MRKVVALVFSLTLLSGCLIMPVETRQEVIQFPSYTYDIAMPASQVVTSWDDNRPSPCLVDGDGAIGLSQRAGTADYEIRFGEQRGVFYALITISPTTANQTRVTVYDNGALRCVEKHREFFEAMAG
jgi:hypothetical protein